MLMKNTRLFHNTIKCKNIKNRLHDLVINGEWKTEPMEIKREVHIFFGNKFHKRWPRRPKLISSDFKVLSMTQRDLLDAPISHEEIKQAI